MEVCNLKPEVKEGLIEWVKINNPDLLENEEKLNHFFNFYVLLSIAEGDSVLDKGVENIGN